MATIEEKQIAKEIVITMLEKSVLLRKEYPETKTVADMVCAAYKTVLAAVSTPE